MIQVVVLHVQRRLRVVSSSMDSLVALQTQSGRAKSRTGGALELHYCDISKGCSAVSLIGYVTLWRWSSLKLLEAVSVSERPWLLSLATASSSFGWLPTPLKVFLHSVLVLLAWATLLFLAGLKLSIQQLTGHAMIVHPDDISHPSQLVMSMASMLVCFAWSRTWRFVIWYCQRMPSMERRAYMQKFSSYLICLRYSVQVSHSYMSCTACVSICVMQRLNRIGARTQPCFISFVMAKAADWLLIVLSCHHEAAGSSSQTSLGSLISPGPSRGPPCWLY